MNMESGRGSAGGPDVTMKKQAGDEKRYPYFVTFYPEGYWAGVEKQYSLVYRISGFIFGVIMFSLVYEVLIYIFLKHALKWDLITTVLTLIISGTLSVPTVRFILGSGFFKISMYAATRIPYSKKSYEEVIKTVEGLVSSYDGDIFQTRTEEKKGAHKTIYAFERSGFEVHVDKVDRMKSTYVFIYLKNKGDRQVYAYFKEKISDALGISTHTAVYDRY